MVEASALITCILGMAAGILALSVLVQVLQELYKYLTNSRALLYRQVLTDTLGPSVARLWTAPEFVDLRVRGSLQFYRRRPAGRLLPLEKGELTGALTRMSPLWVQRVYGLVQKERQFSSETTEPSGAWNALMEQLGEVRRGAPGYWTARQMAECLQNNGYQWTTGEQQVGPLSVDGKVDFARLESAIRERFLPHVARAEQAFPLIERQMEYANGRRNLRQSFVLGLLVAFVVGMPIQTLYQQAVSRSPEETIALAEKLVSLEERREALEADTTIQGEKRLQILIDSMLISLTKTLKTQKDAEDNESGLPGTLMTKSLASTQDPIRAYWHGLKQRTSWAYLLGCLLTAILLSFGAPFWNDIVKSVLYFQQSRRRQIGPSTTAKEDENG